MSFRKHYFQRLVVKNSKSSTCFSICDFEFALNERNVKDSTTCRKWCERFVWIRFSFFSRWFVFFHSTFSDNFVKFSRCAMRFIFFVNVSLSLSFQRIFRFKRTWLRKKNLFTKRRFLLNAKHFVEFLKRKLQFEQHS